MRDLHQKGREIVFQELQRLGLEPTLDSIEQPYGPIEIEKPKKLRLVVRTSAGANEPRRWDAGPYKPENFSDSCFYIFINRWKAESRPHELFVIPSKFLHQVVNWKAGRPKFNMQEGQDHRFKDNWESVLNILRMR